MPGIVRDTDLATEHPGYTPPRRANMTDQHSTGFLVDGKEVCLNGNELVEHCNPSNQCHTGMYVANSTYQVNGESVVVDGDTITSGCTSVAATTYASFNIG